MRCDIYGDVNLGAAEIAPGYPAEANFQMKFENVPCYVWNLLYLLQGEFTFPEREYAYGQMRALLPQRFADASGPFRVRESDEIMNIRIPEGAEDGSDDLMWIGPLNISLVIPHTTHCLLVLRGSH
jgi:hypothetical protein